MAHVTGGLGCVWAQAHAVCRVLLGCDSSNVLSVCAFIQGCADHSLCMARWHVQQGVGKIACQAVLAAFGCQFVVPVGTISTRAGWFAGGWYGVRGSVGGWEESLKWLLQPLSEAGTFLVFPHPMINSASCACRADVSKAIVPCKPCTTQLLGL